MTDRVHSLTVVLEKDMRTDDAEFLINAILALRYVLTVDYTNNISDIESKMAESRAKQELKDKLWEILK